METRDIRPSVPWWRSLLKNVEQTRRLAAQGGPALEVRGRQDMVVLSLDPSFL